MLSVDSKAPWQQELAQAITDPAELSHILKLSVSDHDELLRVCRDFNLRVPRGFVARMREGDAQDPLLLQVLPQARELEKIAGYSADPLQEKQFNPVPGLLHKYHGRVLLTLVGACAINCRYCFRRHFPYQDNIPGMAGWQKALDYVAADSSINEIILSGGDPLVVKDQQLQELILRIEKIPHVKTLRFHTRLPIVIPNRVDDSFMEIMHATRLRKVMVLHTNHANEIDSAVVAAAQRLRQAEFTLLNQSVLLRGINDSAATLIGLSEALFAMGVLPYYLHLLDPVAGAAHFDVPENEAVELWQQMTAKLPGYLVPKLVREVPHKLSKQLVEIRTKSEVLEGA